MIDRIQTHLLDLLQADAVLFAGGTDYAAGWSGVKRPDEGDTPTEGYVTLFDHVKDEQGNRPAIYLGMKHLEAEDTEDFEAVNSERIEFRVLKQPLVMVVTADKQRDAKRQRNQLSANVKKILLPKFAEAGYWWNLKLGTEKTTAAATGGETQGICEATAVITLLIHYSRSPSTLT